MEYFVKVSYFQGVTKRSNYDMLFLLAYAENVNVFIFLSISFSILYFSGKGTCISIHICKFLVHSFSYIITSQN